MITTCPNCQAQLDVPETPLPQHGLECPVCGKNFFYAGGLAFPYGEEIPGVLPEEKIACPHCGQHYDLRSAKLVNGMIGCMTCAGIFVVQQENGVAAFPGNAGFEAAEAISPIPGSGGGAYAGRPKRRRTRGGRSRAISLEPRPSRPISRPVGEKQSGTHN